MRSTLALIALAAAIALLPACAKTRDVDRVDPTTVADLDYRFDEDDARQVANTMISDALAHPWLDRFYEEHGRAPIVIVGDVQNKTADYVPADLFTKQFERALLNSGRVRLVATSDERSQLRDERLQGQEFNRPETVKQMAFELGADLMLIGNVSDNIEISRNRKRRIAYYQTNLELIDIESNEKLWIGTEEIEKRVRDRG